jgi:acyl-CoA synthetase (AMP-forming)/AMP-acid ligase II
LKASGPEHTGELFVRSPSVFSDYYKQNDKFMEDHRDGYQTVGDIAYIDEEGFIFICDRKKDMIISGGMNIYPAEIEAALEQHPGVLEAAVFGIPSEDWGETVHAVVVQNGNAEVNDDILNAHSRVTLASYKVPRSFSWSDELPKTGSGKDSQARVAPTVLGSIQLERSDSVIASGQLECQAGSSITVLTSVPTPVTSTETSRPGSSHSGGSFT